MASTQIAPESKAVNTVNQSDNTATSEIKRIFDLQQQNKQNVKNTSVSQRKRKLRNLKKAILDNKDKIREALYSDFSKPYSETDLTEIYPTTAEIKHAISDLGNWMKPQKVDTPVSFAGSSSYIMYEPKGVCLIISPWNYPFNLCMIPLVSAIAAGNTAIIKPSEFTPNTTEIVKEIVSEVFQENEVAIVEGDYNVSGELLKLKFDHIFFTGSPNVGKVVMRAAAENLTSVTLELGGKSPVVVDDTANISSAVKRLTWGKYLNCGQTCIAPDYMMVHQKKYDETLQKLKENIQKVYGATKEEQLKSDSYARIVNKKHFNRLKTLVEDAVEKGANIYFGGNMLEEENYIQPTILTDVPDNAKIMQEEIFGPLFPVQKIQDIKDAIEVINQKEKPLAMYIFSTDKNNTRELLNNTSSGGVTINDTVLHHSQPNLPFGGVNHSGIGSGHGYFGFKAFSHERAVLKQASGFSAVEGMYPPYGGVKDTLIDLTIKYL